MLLARRGDPPAVLLRRVEFLPTAERVYAAYWEIDRSEWGVPLFSGMRAVLDEYGWTDPEQRRAVRGLWRAMYGEEAKAREVKRKAADEAKEATGEQGSTRRAGRRRELGELGED